MLRGHPWIFSGAIHSGDKTSPGDWVEVLDWQKKYLASGHVGDGSIAVRILGYDAETPNEAFWNSKLSNCKSMRQMLPGLQKETNAYRLVHGEGDFLPGLIIDIYKDAAVIQAHSHGMFMAVKDIAAALDEVFEQQLNTIYCKSKAAMHMNMDGDYFLKGDMPETVVKENGIQFKVNWVEGQKTGFFLDQRENRQLLATYSNGKSVLNTFCYTGGFSAYALQAGADSVTSVDVSAKAISLTEENIRLNSNKPQNHEAICADVNEFLKDHNKDYDIVILDPPAYAKSLAKKHQAVMGYKRLNMAGIKSVKPGGLLFTFSCSQVIDDKLFANTVTAAGIESGRKLRILHRLGQGPDHPVNLFHPEGHYLKGLVLEVE